MLLKTLLSMRHIKEFLQRDFTQKSTTLLLIIQQWMDSLSDFKTHRKPRPHWISLQPHKQPQETSNSLCQLVKPFVSWTGAPVPDGADAIIPIEACTIDGNSVTLNQPSKPHFIRKRGENIAEGQVGLEKGCYLTPQSISMCATMGYSSVPVIQNSKLESYQLEMN